MKSKRINTFCITAALTAGVMGLEVAPASAAVVTPKMNGGSSMIMGQGMIMPEITFDGSAVHVLDEMGSAWINPSPLPVLRPLIPGDTFTAGPWTVMTGTAYNYQYGWDAGLLDLTSHPLPSGSAIWIEVTDQSPGLKTFDRGNGYAPILGTAGSSTNWKWPMMMSHNAYALEESLVGGATQPLFADYTLYIGDAITGAVLSGYTPATVTLQWTAVPEPMTLGLLMLGGLAATGRRRRA